MPDPGITAYDFLNSLGMLDVLDERTYDHRPPPHSGSHGGLPRATRAGILNRSGPAARRALPSSFYDPAFNRGPSMENILSTLAPLQEPRRGRGTGLTVGERGSGISSPRAPTREPSGPLPTTGRDTNVPWRGRGTHSSSGTLGGIVSPRGPYRSESTEVLNESSPYRGRGVHTSSGKRGEVNSTRAPRRGSAPLDALLGGTAAVLGSIPGPSPDTTQDVNRDVQRDLERVNKESASKPPARRVEAEEAAMAGLDYQPDDSLSKPGSGPVNRSAQPNIEKVAAPAQKTGLFSSDTQRVLMDLGTSMMASSRSDFLGAIGESAQQAMANYDARVAAANAAAHEEFKLALKAKEVSIDEQRMKSLAKYYDSLGAQARAGNLEMIGTRDGRPVFVDKTSGQQWTPNVKLDRDGTILDGGDLSNLILASALSTDPEQQKNIDALIALAFQDLASKMNQEDLPPLGTRDTSSTAPRKGRPTVTSDELSKYTR